METATDPQSVETATAPPLESRRRVSAGVFRALRKLVRDPAAAAGLVFILLLVLLAVTGGLLAPYDPLALDIPARLEGPTADHLLGTDLLGRDLLSRMIAGTRIGFEIAVPTVALAGLIGVLLGVAGGYLGGLADAVMLYVIDFLAAFPGLILALALVTLLGSSIRNIIIALVFALIPTYARVARASVLAIKEEGFVLAERALGASAWRIAALHVVPNMIAPIFILVAMDIPIVVLAEAGLSFLGLGVPPPEPSWGAVLAEGFSNFRESPWPVVWPAVAIGLTMIAFTLVGEALRNILDPRAPGARPRGV